MEYRSKTVASLLGVIHLERAYYHGRHGHAGLVPWDQTLRRSSEALTPAARDVVCMAGRLSTFAEAATLSLPKLSGLRVSESTVQRTTEGTGQDVGARLASRQTFGSPSTWPWHRDAEDKTCAYVSLDATGVRRQGRRGGKAEGRMVTVAMVYNPVPEQRERWARPEGRTPRFDVRYLAGLNGIAVLGEPLRRQAGHVGMDQAERWIALSDGGASLEDWLRTHFGRVEAVILDFYHATEYLAELGRTLHPSDEAARDKWLESWCHRLKHQGGACVLDDLRELKVRGHAAGKAKEEVVRYFTNQAHRMDYPTYLAKGWSISSGPVESACTTVIGQRMKDAEMRWGEQGADEVSHLRCLFKSGDDQWNAYWHLAARIHYPQT